MKKTDTKDILLTHIETHKPIIYINHFDFNYLDSLIEEIKEKKLNDAIIYYEFLSGVGQIDFNTKAKIDYKTLNEFLVLMHDLDEKNTYFIILKDIHNELSDINIISQLKYISNQSLYSEKDIIIFIVSTKLVIPKEIEHIITLLDIPAPNHIEIIEIISDFIKKYELTMDKKELNNISIQLNGFSHYEINKLLNDCYYESGGDLEPERLRKLIVQEKEQTLKKSGLVELINFSERIEDIGGLENLKSWLEKKSKVFKRLDEAISNGLDIPHGALIVGMPGCGKSLTAKATARMFEMPLLRLDVGKLLGKYVGESEENMRNAIKVIETSSPCVLWVDELEKAFAGINPSGSGNEVTTRLFGFFLTWLQEKTSPVFVIATANDIDNLPPEFLRKGRFDEIFFVDFPNKKERKNIFEIHLKKRKKFNDTINLEKIASASEKYTGADIEAVVKECVEEAFIENKKDISAEDILNELKETKPLADSLKDKIAKLQEALKKYDMKKASRD